MCGYALIENNLGPLTPLDMHPILKMLSPKKPITFLHFYRSKPVSVDLPHYMLPLLFDAIVRTTRKRGACYGLDFISDKSAQVIFLQT
jgi:hypothetical protein